MNAHCCSASFLLCRFRGFQRENDPIPGAVSSHLCEQKINSPQVCLPDDSRFCQVDSTIKTPKKWKRLPVASLGHYHKMRVPLLA